MGGKKSLPFPSQLFVNTKREGWEATNLIELDPFGILLEHIGESLADLLLALPGGAHGQQDRLELLGLTQHVILIGSNVD